VRQMQGRYKVKSPDLKPLHERAAKLARQIQYFVIEHVRRELNSDADALANIALDQANERRAPQLQTSSAKETLTAESRVPSSREPLRSSIKIRARFQNGVLVPAEPLDLPEGSDVTLSVCK